MLRNALYAKILLEKKERLVEEIRKIDEEIFKNACQDQHISVRNFQNYGDYRIKKQYPYRCVLCGEILKEPASFSVDGHHAGMYSDIELEEIEQEALEILSKNPNLSKKELSDFLHTFMYDRERRYQEAKHMQPKRKIKSYYIQPFDGKKR